MSQSSSPALSVVVAGGGIAGAEALLALRALGGDRVKLTLVAPGPDLVLRPLAVAEPFSLGRVSRHPVADLVAAAEADWIADSLAEVDPSAREILLESGERLGYDALVVAVGAKAVVGIEHATTWWPEGDPEIYGGLLRDMEEGYVKRVAFAIPAGAAWPLPCYELALMTAREVSAMGIDDAELTVITPEAIPLVLFGPEAAGALGEELAAAGVRLEAGALARVERGNETTVVLEPTDRRLVVDRVVAVPEVVGRVVPGLPTDPEGFIPVDGYCRVRGADRIWAAGDGIAYPVKFGGLATQQADTLAAAIAALAGAAVESLPLQPRLRGMLMTGAEPRALGEDHPPAAPVQPIWRPVGKISGAYLSPHLGRAALLVRAEAIVVDEALPGLEEVEEGRFSPLWRPDQSHPDFLRRLGRQMHGYEAALLRSERIARDRGARPAVVTP